MICYSICVFLSIFLTSFSHVIAVGKSSFLWLNNIPLCVCVYIHTHYIHIHISFMYSSISGYLGVQYSISDRGMASPKTSFLQTHECSWGELEGVVKYPSLGGLQTFKGLYILKWSRVLRRLFLTCTHLHTHTDIKLELKTYRVSVLGLRGRKGTRASLGSGGFHKLGWSQTVGWGEAPTCLGRTTTFASASG